MAFGTTLQKSGRSMHPLLKLSKMKWRNQLIDPVLPPEGGVFRARESFVTTTAEMITGVELVKRPDINVITGEFSKRFIDGKGLVENINQELSLQSIDVDEKGGESLFCEEVAECCGGIDKVCTSMHELFTILCRQSRAQHGFLRTKIHSSDGKRRRYSNFSFSVDQEGKICIVETFLPETEVGCWNLAAYEVGPNFEFPPGSVILVRQD